MSSSAETVAIVPTLGRSPYLRGCLEALRRQDDGALAVVLVLQGDADPDLPRGLTDRVVRRPVPLGFSRATNLGLDETEAPLVATINDDAILDDGWLAALRAELLADESVAAVQGTNLDLHQPTLVDGRGLRWNRWWQAVQIDHGTTAHEGDGALRQVFGVSATAALYRRRALLRVVLDGGAIFDPGLDSYYEDVDLACRLRSAGLGALHVPTARARHAGSTTSPDADRLPLVYGNRYLVAARFLGRAFWARVPLLVLRDVLDVVVAPAAGIGRRRRARAVARGLRRSASRLGAYAHFGRPGMRPKLVHREPALGEQVAVRP